MNAEKIKKIIIFIIIIILMLIAGIATIILINNKKEVTPSRAEEESDRIVSEEGKVEDVKSFKAFYNASNCANKYIRAIKSENREMLYKLINNEYININNLTENNVLTYTNYIESEETLYIKKMYQQSFPDDANQYVYIDGLLRKSNDNVLYERSIFLTIIINQNSYTFSIVPNKDKFPEELQKIEEIDRNFEMLNVPIEYVYTETYTQESNSEENNVGTGLSARAEGYTDQIDNIDTINKYREQDVSNDYIARSYFMDYITNLKYYGKNLYANLDENYRNKRFGSIYEFEKYINDISKDINKFTLASYAINEYNNYTEYMCIDKYGNYYLFNATSVMDYTIKLDDYTEKTNNYVSVYNGLSDANKVSKNVDIFIQMVNTKDYSHIYQVLDETFRNQNFGSDETLKEFINNNFFEYNKKGEITVERADQYYTATIELTDATSKSDTIKSLKIIMQLKDGTDFVMSFSID